MLTESSEGLKRVIGVRSLAATVVNLSIGAGIFVLPAIISIQLGASGVIGYLLCGLMFVSIILCYVEIGSRVKSSGGSYAYVEAAFGPFAGFIINWLFFFGWGILSSAAIMNLVADSLTVVFPFLGDFILRSILSFVLLLFMVIINVLDTKKSVQFLTFITLVKLLPLLGIIIFGFMHVQLSNLKIDHLPSLQSFGETALILFFAFAGFESSLSVSGEIKDPKRTIPRGILWGGVTVFLFYVLIQMVVQGVLGAQVADFKAAPLAAVGERIVGTTGLTIVLIAAALSGLGALNGDILSSPRLLFAGARDGLFPRFLAKIHPRFATPYMAVITYAALIFIFSVSGGFKQLAILASGALLIIYFGVILSLIKFRSKKNDNAEKSFKVPGGLTIPFIAIAAIVYVLSNLTRQEILSLFGFIALVCLVYFIMKKFKRKRAIMPLESLLTKEVVPESVT